MTMSNQAARIAEAEHARHFIAPVLVMLKNDLAAHGLQHPYGIQLQVTCPDDSVLTMSLHSDGNTMTLSGPDATPSLYVREES
jgi:hypothetical protein